MNDRKSISSNSSAKETENMGCKEHRPSGQMSVAQPSQIIKKEENASIVEMGGPSGESVRSGWKSSQGEGLYRGPVSNIEKEYVRCPASKDGVSGKCVQREDCVASNEVRSKVVESANSCKMCQGPVSSCVCAGSSVIGQNPTNSETVRCAVQVFDDTKGGTKHKTGRGGHAAVSFEKLYQKKGKGARVALLC